MYLSCSHLPNKHVAVRGNSVPSPPLLLITTILPCSGISDYLETRRTKTLVLKSRTGPQEGKTYIRILTWINVIDFRGQAVKPCFSFQLSCARSSRGKEFKLCIVNVRYVYRIMASQWFEFLRPNTCKFWHRSGIISKGKISQTHTKAFEVEKSHEETIEFTAKSLIKTAPTESRNKRLCETFKHRAPLPANPRWV